MASQADNYLFKLCEEELIVYRKEDQKNIPIHEHIGKISNFLKFFEIQKLNEEVKCGIFLKYFSSDLIKEVKSQPDFDSQKISIDYLKAEFIKVLELKSLKLVKFLEFSISYKNVVKA